MIGSLASQVQRRTICLLLISGTIALIGAVICQLWVPEIVKRVIDDPPISIKSAPIFISACCALFVLSTVGIQLFRSLGIFSFANAGWILAEILRTSLVHQCFDRPFEVVIERSPGSISELIEGDTSKIANFFSDMIFQLLFGLLLLSGIIYRSGENAGFLPAVAIIILIAIAGYLISKDPEKQTKHHLLERTAEADLLTFAEDHLSGWPEIGANDGAEYVLKKLRELGDKVELFGIYAYKHGAVRAIITTNVIFIIAEALALGWGVWLLMKGQGSIGSIYINVQYVVLARSPLESLASQFAQTQAAVASWRRIQTALSTQTEVAFPGRGEAWPAGPAHIELSEVCLVYGSGRPALADVSCRFDAGRITAIVGRTGSGKSSIVHILSGLVKPTNGMIKINGVDLGTISSGHLRQNMGIVTQSALVLPLSLRDNLTMMQVAPTDDVLLEALAAVGLAHWISSLPRGLSTLLLSEAHPSKSEVQRLALARMIVQDPAILVLDEVLSSADPKDEIRLTTLIRALTRRRDGFLRTIILVTHRLSHLACCDDVFVLHEGALVECGQRESLLAQPTSRLKALLQEHAA